MAHADDQVGLAAHHRAGHGGGIIARGQRGHAGVAGGGVAGRHDGVAGAAGQAVGVLRGQHDGGAADAGTTADLQAAHGAAGRHGRQRAARLGIVAGDGGRGRQDQAAAILHQGVAGDADTVVQHEVAGQHHIAGRAGQGATGAVDTRQGAERGAAAAGDGQVGRGGMDDVAGDDAGVGDRAQRAAVPDGRHGAGDGAAVAQGADGAGVDEARLAALDQAAVDQRADDGRGRAVVDAGDRRAQDGAAVHQRADGATDGAGGADHRTDHRLWALKEGGYHRGKGARPRYAVDDAALATAEHPLVGRRRDGAALAGLRADGDVAPVEAVGQIIIGDGGRLNRADVLDAGNRATRDGAAIGQCVDPASHLNAIHATMKGAAVAERPNATGMGGCGAGIVGGLIQADRSGATLDHAFVVHGADGARDLQGGAGRGDGASRQIEQGAKSSAEHGDGGGEGGGALVGDQPSVPQGIDRRVKQDGRLRAHADKGTARQIVDQADAAHRHTVVQRRAQRVEGHRPGNHTAIGKRADVDTA
ncbi:hypothetical protein AZA_42208 [Nitrospirillum viridazoti Y2]|nr:hypothetical protein AZA_42208 [Nitrospirillum amazonense Y2]